jgi:hypothetical protein
VMLLLYVYQIRLGANDKLGLSFPKSLPPEGHPRENIPNPWHRNYPVFS